MSVVLLSPPKIDRAKADSGDGNTTHTTRITRQRLPKAHLWHRTINTAVALHTVLEPSARFLQVCPKLPSLDPRHQSVVHHRRVSFLLTGPSTTSASSTMSGPPEDSGPPIAIILIKILNLASMAYKIPVERGIQRHRRGITSVNINVNPQNSACLPVTRVLACFNLLRHQCSRDTARC